MAHPIGFMAKRSTVSNFTLFKQYVKESVDQHGKMMSHISSLLWHLTGFTFQIFFKNVNGLFPICLLYYYLYHICMTSSSLFLTIHPILLPHLLLRMTEKYFQLLLPWTIVISFKLRKNTTV